MSVKIYGATLNDIRLVKPTPLIPEGPGFFLTSTRDIKTMYPAIMDGSSGGILTISANMGQTSFMGDPLGYQPYDTSYSTANWSGSFSIDGDNIIPDNLRTAVYNKQYSSGKYYYELTLVDDGYSAALGFSPASGTTSILIDNGVGVKGVGTYSSTVKQIETDQLWTTVGSQLVSGDVLQIWVDFDNNLMCVKKLGTTIDDYNYYVTE